MTVPPPPTGTPPGPGHPAARRTLPWWGDTVVGAAFAAEEAATDLITGLRRAAARRGERIAQLADRGATERERWRRRVDQTADRGATEREHWRQWLEKTVEAAVTRAATSPLIDRVVDHQLQRVLRPVVLAVLDDVLLLLEKEPERIQMLVRGQRETMVDELVGRLRAGAEAGDTVVDRLTFRAFHRGHRPQPPPPLDL